MKSLTLQKISENSDSVNFCIDTQSHRLHEFGTNGHSYRCKDTLLISDARPGVEKCLDSFNFYVRGSERYSDRDMIAVTRKDYDKIQEAVDDYNDYFREEEAPKEKKPLAKKSSANGSAALTLKVFTEHNDHVVFTIDKQTVWDFPDFSYNDGNSYAIISSPNVSSTRVPETWEVSTQRLVVLRLGEHSSLRAPLVIPVKTYATLSMAVKKFNASFHRHDDKGRFIVEPYIDEAVYCLRPYDSSPVCEITWTNEDCQKITLRNKLLFVSREAAMKFIK